MTTWSNFNVDRSSSIEKKTSELFSPIFSPTSREEFGLCRAGLVCAHILTYHNIFNKLFFVFLLLLLRYPSHIQTLNSATTTNVLRYIARSPTRLAEHFFLHVFSLRCCTSAVFLLSSRSTAVPSSRHLTFGIGEKKKHQAQREEETVVTVAALNKKKISSSVQLDNVVSSIE